MKRLFPIILAFLCVPLVSGAREEGLSEDLFRAIRKNDLAAVKVLLRKGVDVNAKDSDGATPLMYAALYAAPECMKLLLEKGADPNAKSAAGVAALMWGIGDIRKVRLLLAKGADVNARSKAGKTPLLLAASYDGAFDTVKLLVEKGADATAKDEAGAGAVILAAESGDVATLRLLIEKGADVNARAGPHFNEVQFGTLTPAREQLAEERRQLNLGLTPLMMAADQGNREAVKLLLEKGADVNAATGGGFTALHAAALRDDPEMVRALIEKGAEVNRQDFQGHTPLITAAAADGLSVEVIRALLGKGADVNVKSKDGHTALQRAKTKGETEIVKLLRQAGATE